MAAHAPIPGGADSPFRPRAQGEPGPDFIILGTQKGGTSSLYKYLTDHPQVLPASTKELHWFDTTFKSGTPYSARFPAHPRRPWRRRTISGEATPYYLFHPLAPQRIHQWDPTLRLIVALRDPVARALSHHQMQRERGHEDLDFPKAIDRERRLLPAEERRLLDDPTYVSPIHRRQSYVARGFYGRQVRRYLDLFPRTQLHVEVSEDLFADAQPVVDRIARFLRIRPRPLADAGPVRVGTYTERVDDALEAELRAEYAQDRADLERLLGRTMPWPRS